MGRVHGMASRVEESVALLFALVSEALAQATWALLNADPALASTVISGDRAIDERTARLEGLVWSEIDASSSDPQAVRRLVPVLLILPELERSADLAEHIAQRALANVGNEMTPTSRGIVQRMSEVALELWEATTVAYSTGSSDDLELDEVDEELDILRDRLTAEVAAGGMQPGIAAQVTLLARFYERIGDHAVNLSRRVVTLGR